MLVQPEHSLPYISSGAGLELLTSTSKKYIPVTRTSY